MRVPIEGLDQRIESFLTCRIPELQFDTDVAIDFHTLGVVLNPQCHCVVLHELIGQVTLDKTALATSGIANHNDLKHQVVMLLRRHYIIKGSYKR